MTNVKQVRFAEVEKNVGAETLSRVYVQEDGQTVYQCCLLELPWRDNQNGGSRIPGGRYVLEVVDHSPAFSYPHLWLHEHGSVYATEDRSGIKWHVANFARQLRGCGAPGQQFVDLDGDGLVDVTSSERTLEGLVEVLPKKTALHIENQELGQMQSAKLEEVGVPSIEQQLKSLDLN